MKAISKEVTELIHVPSPRPDLSDFEETGIFSSKLWEPRLNPPCPKTRTSLARHRVQFFHFILPCPLKEITIWSRKAKTSMNSKSSTLLKSGNWKKMHFRRSEMRLWFYLGKKKRKNNFGPVPRLHNELRTVRNKYHFLPVPHFFSVLHYYCFKQIKSHTVVFH